MNGIAENTRQRPDSGWLADEEQQAWRSYLAMSRGLTEALERQLQRDSGLWLSDYEILVTLSEAPDQRMRMGELAATTTFSQSRLSHAVSRLEASSWVERERCPNDGRGTFAQLTDAGLTKLRAAAPGHVEAVRRLFLEPLGYEGARTLGELAALVRNAACGEAAKDEDLAR